MSDGLEKVTLLKKWSRYPKDSVIWADPIRAANLIERKIAVAGDVKPKRKNKEVDDS